MERHSQEGQDYQSCSAIEEEDTSVMGSQDIEEKYIVYSGI